MERSIRIGKDFNVRWSINKVVDGERQPYELAGKELVLQYRTPYGLKEATEWKVVGNTIVWTFRGKEQKALGSYELILTENGGKDGMVTVDTCRAFKLVAHSCEETEGSGSDIVIEDVVLESEVAFAALRGPQGEQGPAGPSYDDTEIKGKLAELSEENERLKERIEEQDVFIEDLEYHKLTANSDNRYPDLSVGTADNLAGVDVVDSEINFRRSGGGAISDGVARIETIKGNSVVWNEIFRAYPGNTGTKVINGVTYTMTAEGDLTAEGTAEGASAVFVVAATNLINTHKYLINAPSVESSWNTWALYFNGYTTKQNSSEVFGGWSIFQATDTAPSNMVLTCWAGKTISVKTKVAIYDLTKMFGAGNEPTTIEEFYQRIPMGVDLDAYNEGEVIHMDVQSIESVGVNQWDEVLELGTYSNTTGQPTAATTTVRNAHLFPCKGGAKYYWGAPKNAAFYQYDEKGSFLGMTAITSRAEFITHPQTAYAGFRLLVSDYGTTYNHDICINLSDASINGKYYPYIKRVEDLSLVRKYFPDGMKSAGTAHDEIRYNKASGKWEKVVRIGEVDMGTLDWGYNNYGEGDASNRFSLNALKFPSMKIPSSNEELNIVTSKYPVSSLRNVRDKDKVIMPSVYSNEIIAIKDTAYTDLASFKAAMAGVMLYYELAEPIVTELDEADQFKDLDYQVWNCGTEKAIAEGKSAPLAADITYGFNAIGKIKELESLVAALRAKVGI